MLGDGTILTAFSAEITHYARIHEIALEFAKHRLAQNEPGISPAKEFELFLQTYESAYMVASDRHEGY